MNVRHVNFDFAERAACLGGDNLHGRRMGFGGWDRHDMARMARERGGLGGFEGPGIGFGRGREHGPRGRFFEQGDLRWLTLDLIAQQPRHGYEVIKAIEDELSGGYAPSPGAIYPLLTMLEETGLIEGETQGNKKLYRLTESGREELDKNVALVEAMKSRFAEAASRFGNKFPPEMMRAMGNLRGALQVRLAKGELSPESLAAITAAIDRAAREIEGS